jgi:hypothetical protein
MVYEDQDDYKPSFSAHRKVKARIMKSMYMDPSDPDYPDVPEGFDSDEALKQLDEECF